MAHSRDGGFGHAVRAGQERPRSAPRSDVIRKISQILGELLITAGVVLLLFVGWQLWWTNVEADAKQSESHQELRPGTGRFQGPVTSAPPGETAAAPADYGPPVVATAPGHGGTIGIMYIPRFGADYTRPIIEGTGHGRPGYAGPWPLRKHGDARGNR